MRLRLLDRVRRSRRRREAEKLLARERGDAISGPAAPTGTAGTHRRVGGPPGHHAGPPDGRPAPPAGYPGQPGAHAGPPSSRPAPSGGYSGQPGAHAGQPSSRPAPPAGYPGQPGAHAGPPSSRPAAPAGQPGGRGDSSPGRAGRPAGHALPRRWGIARVATRAAAKADAAADTVGRAQPGRAARRAVAPGAPWYEIAQSNRTAAGRRHCGHLEPLVHREWAEDAVPSPEVVRAIDRLAELPQLIKAKLMTGLDAIYVGMGGVPDLDDMGRLSGVPLPSGRATWDACAGAYGERKIIVGSRPSPSPDVMCHEIGHALDDIDGEGEQWQSDSAEFQSLYEQCQPHMVSAFHRQPGMLGRREFFADAFAAIASRQRPALVEMLGGDTRAALNVMLYFNVRYGI